MIKLSEKAKKIYRMCPARHILLLISAAVIAFHFITRNDHALTSSLSISFIRPLHGFLAILNSRVPFSVAELLLAAVVLFAVVYLLIQIILLAVRNSRGRRVYRTILTYLSFGLAIYAGFCILWGTYYYGDDFNADNGFKEEKISLEQLETVTRYFAGICNDYAPAVPREETGICCLDRGAVLERSDEVYENVIKDYPGLSGPKTLAKGILHSRIMSFLDFTGFFFPFTAEANVNMDSPSVDLPATVAHELAHQRGVSREQEANFCAVLASMYYGDPEYVYSAAVLAYTHLSNALYSADYEAWERIFYTLDASVVADLRYINAYWEQFDTPVADASNAVYEGFLQSYGQELGLKSYGACVDLLVNYYYPEAVEAIP